MLAPLTSMMNWRTSGGKLSFAAIGRSQTKSSAPVASWRTLEVWSGTEATSMFLTTIGPIT